MQSRASEPPRAGPLVPPLDPACEPIGRTIADKYFLRERIGTGSMGDVYRARHTALGRDVALKLMAPELAHDRNFVARFRREAHAASRLTHPSSVATTDFGEEADGLLYLVMEYVPGESLETLLARGETLSESRIVHILSQVLSAAAAAHDAGIVHRDLKPANVLVTQATDDDDNPVERVKVCDFGVASLRDRADLVTTGTHLLLRDGASEDITMAGAVVGTPAYMAPEQAGGGKPDARTDLYAVGVMLFELLTGRLPLYGDTPEETLARQIDSLPPSPRDLVDCSKSLADVCLRALSKPMAQRYGSARAMRAALRAAIEPVSAPAPVQPAAAKPTEPPRTRARAPWALAAATLLGGIACAAWMTRERPAAATVIAAAAPVEVRRAVPVEEQPTPAPAAAPATYTPEHAHVRIGVAGASGLRPEMVRAMVSRVDLDRCYRVTLRALGRREAGRGTVTMYLDGDGVVQSARVLPPATLGDAAACIASKLRTLRAPEAPATGSALAMLTLAFEP